MARLPFDDTKGTVDQRYFYAKVLAVYEIDDTLDILELTLTSGSKTPTPPTNPDEVAQKTYYKCPIFYHCDPSAEKRENGALKNSASIFVVDDVVYVSRSSPLPIVLCPAGHLHNCGPVISMVYDHPEKGLMDYIWHPGSKTIEDPKQYVVIGNYTRQFLYSGVDESGMAWHCHEEGYDILPAAYATTIQPFWASLLAGHIVENVTKDSFEVTEYRSSSDIWKRYRYEKDPTRPNEGYCLKTQLANMNNPYYTTLPYSNNEFWDTELITPPPPIDIKLPEYNSLPSVTFAYAHVFDWLTYVNLEYIEETKTWIETQSRSTNCNSMDPGKIHIHLTKYFDPIYPCQFRSRGTSAYQLKLDYLREYAEVIDNSYPDHTFNVNWTVDRTEAKLQFAGETISKTCYLSGYTQGHYDNSTNWFTYEGRRNGSRLYTINFSAIYDLQYFSHYIDCLYCYGHSYSKPAVFMHPQKPKSRSIPIFVLALNYWTEDYTNQSRTFECTQDNQDLWYCGQRDNYDRGPADPISPGDFMNGYMCYMGADKVEGWKYFLWMDPDHTEIVNAYFNPDPPLQANVTPNNTELGTLSILPGEPDHYVRYTYTYYNEASYPKTHCAFTSKGGLSVIWNPDGGLVYNSTVDKSLSTEAVSTEDWYTAWWDALNPTKVTDLNFEWSRLKGVYVLPRAFPTQA